MLSCSHVCKFSIIGLTSVELSHIYVNSGVYFLHVNFYMIIVICIGLVWYKSQSACDVICFYSLFQRILERNVSI